MQIGLIILAATYLFCFVVVLLMGPMDQPWLPKPFQEGGHLRKAAPVVLALPVLCAPVLLLVLTACKAWFWTRARLASRRQACAPAPAHAPHAHKYDGRSSSEPTDTAAAAAAAADLEAARGSPDLTLSSSDILPMFDRDDFSLAPTTPSPDMSVHTK